MHVNRKFIKVFSFQAHTQRCVEITMLHAHGLARNEQTHGYYYHRGKHLHACQSLIVLDDSSVVRKLFEGIDLFLYNATSLLFIFFDAACVVMLWLWNWTATILQKPH